MKNFTGLSQPQQQAQKTHLAANIGTREKRMTKYQIAANEFKSLLIIVELKLYELR